MVRRLLAAIPAVAISAALAPASHAAGAIEGDWLTPQDGARVHIERCDQHPEDLCGRIVWLKSPNGGDGQPRRDGNNPDPALRDRPVIGLAMLSGMHAVSAGRWSGGRIYDPGSGKSYDSKLTDMGAGALKVEGCIAFLCVAQTWRRTP